MDSIADSDDHAVTIWQHAKKPEWGFAVLAWEQDGKRGYQFEDGKLRVFKQGYYHLLDEVELPDGERGSKLLATARRTDSATASTTAIAPQPSEIGLDNQIDYFVANYPGGFAAEKWQLEHRNRAERALKRHREPVIARAQEELSREHLDAWLEEQQAQPLHVLCDLLARTDLVTAAQIKPLGDVVSYHTRPIVQTLRDLLWGEGAMVVRFDAWVHSLTVAFGRPPAWPLATALLALVHPNEHVCVRASIFNVQSAGLVPVPLQLGNKPSHVLYDRVLAVVSRVRERLAERELPPTDLLDVHDFIWTTLRPKARAEIEALVHTESAESAG